jgi:molybdopterin-guanine dinucleotide biosynthesis protein A
LKPSIHKKLETEAWILAGGLSSRMGRDKGQLRLGRRTMLEHIRAVVRQVKIPVRTVRRDVVPRCGPIGGICTALERSRTEVVVVLACDMPFVTPEFLERMVGAMTPGANAVFARKNGRAGFPCAFRRERCLPVVRRRIAESKYSLQALAMTLEAKWVGPGRDGKCPLTNLNTPSELAKARLRMKEPSDSGKALGNPKSRRTAKPELNVANQSRTLFRRSLSKARNADKMRQC